MRDAVENLGVAYIEIKKEGCIQFDDMKVVVHCNPDDAVAIEIRLQSIKQVMKGMSLEKPAVEHCQNVYAYLKSCITKWRQSMDEKRRYGVTCVYYIITGHLYKLHMLSQHLSVNRIGG